MDKAIVDFIQALRHHGLPISPAETLDALHATAAMGVANRQRLKIGLAMTLAKTLPHRGLLENLFDQVFAAQESVEQGDNVGAEGNGFSSSALASDDSPIQSPLGQQLLHNQTAALHLAMVRAAEEVGAKEMKIFLQKRRVASQILLQMGDRELQHELLALEQQGSHLGLVAEIRQQRQQWVDRVTDHVEQQYLLFSGKRGEQLSEDTLRKIKFSHLDHIQQQQMARVVAKVAMKLASLHSRRRKVSKRGLLDVRKTIAANAAFDGFLFHTRWKSTRVDRPRVIVICDLSRSVSQFAKFLLLFVYSLQEVLPRVRSFVFSSEMVEVTNAFKTYERDEALSLIMARWANHSTDYGRALQDFSDHALKDIDHKTQVIMLGDARNNYDDGRIDLWQTIANRAQRVLWLNPEDRSRWHTGDSIMGKYAPFCAMVEQCNSLRDMERVLGRLLKYVN